MPEPTTFTEYVRAVQNNPEIFTIGKVTAINEADMTCTVTPEDGGENIEDIPLRIMRHPDAVGFTVIPVDQTEAIVMWLGPHRPTIFRVHAWNKVVIQNDKGHGIIINPANVILGIEEESEPAVLGDQLAQRIAALESAYNSHTHDGVLAGGAITGNVDFTVDGEPEVRTWKTRLT